MQVLYVQYYCKSRGWVCSLLAPVWPSRQHTNYQPKSIKALGSNERLPGSRREGQTTSTAAIYQPINQYIYQSINLSIHPSINQSINQINQSIQSMKPQGLKRARSAAPCKKEKNSSGVAPKIDYRVRQNCCSTSAGNTKIPYGTTRGRTIDDARTCMT